MLRVQDQAK
jgi:hypothetical protein